MGETWNVVLTLTVSEGNNEKINESIELTEIKNMSERRNITIVDDTTDKEISFSDIGTVEELLIISDQPITIKKNANTGTAMTGKTFLFNKSSFTSIFVTNASGDDANVKIIAGG